MAAILNSATLHSAILVFPLKLTHTCQDWFPLFTPKKPWLIHSDSTWWWQPSWTLPSCIQPFCTKKLHSFILTQLDDDSHLEFCQPEFGHLGSSHLSFSSQTHLHLPRLIPTICTKKTSLIHSDSTGWWHPSWTLPCWIQTLPSWIQISCYILSD